MATCEDLIHRARVQIIAGAATFGGVAAAIIYAIALNAGVFSAPGAPGAMAAAAGLATATAGTLTAALLALNEWASRDDCMYRVCAPNLENIRRALIAAIAAATAVAVSCAKIAGYAWIPFAAQPPMWLVCGAAGTVAVSLAALLPLWDALTYCQIDGPVATSISALEPGEKKGDPWFLRLVPSNGSDFATPSRASGKDSHGLSNQWLECALFDVQEWRVTATANIFGMAPLPVHFTWKFDGKNITASSTQTSATSATVSINSAPLASPVMLEVTATDASGYSRTKKTEISLPNTDMKCHLVLHFVPPLDRIPTEPPGPVEINAKLQSLLEFARKVPEPQIPDAPFPDNE